MRWWRRGTYYSIGGFGGGKGGHGGGGGLGAGGDIFVQAHGKLVLQAGTLQGGAVVAGSVGAGLGGGAGSFFGSGIFLQGNETITLAPGMGQTLDIQDQIADEMGSVGTSDTHQGGLVIGPGTVELNNINSYTGGTSIEAGGVLELGTVGGAGSGAITLPAAATTTLVINIGSIGVAIANTHRWPGRGRCVRPARLRAERHNGGDRAVRRARRPVERDPAARRHAAHLGDTAAGQGAS